MACCVDKASADPGDFWTWGGSSDLGAGHQAFASYTYHWMRAPWGNSAIGKAIAIGADTETPPSSWGLSFFSGGTSGGHHTNSLIVRETNLLYICVCVCVCVCVYLFKCHTIHLFEHTK